MSPENEQLFRDHKEFARVGRLLFSYRVPPSNPMAQRSKTAILHNILWYIELRISSSQGSWGMARSPAVSAILFNLS